MYSKLSIIKSENKLSLSENPAYSAIDYEIIRGLRKDSQLLWIPSEKQIYKKNTNSLNYGIHYLCNMKQCKVRVYIKDNVCYKLNAVTHDHETNESQYEKLFVLNEMKEKAMTVNNINLKNMFDNVMARHQNVTLSFKDHARTFQKLRNTSLSLHEATLSEPDVSTTVTMSAHENPTISTHILDTSLGKAAANIPVTLYANLDSNNWTEISKSSTNNDGRCTDLTTANVKLETGLYKLRFDTAEYFQKTTTKYLYPFVEIVFYCETGQHYHIPLLLQPFGYTTYRGT